MHPADPPPRTWRARDPLRIAFRGFNPLGDGYDGRGRIDAGADRSFASLDAVGALRLVRRYFDLDRDGRLTAADGPPFDLRVTGYSFGGWTALRLVHALAPVGRLFRVRLGLCDPVSTFRPASTWRVVPRTLRVGRRLAVPWLGLGRGPLYASRPPWVAWGVNVFQTKGLIARLNGDGPRLPYRAKWFASRPIDGLDNRDVSAEVTDGTGHIDVAELYARRVADETFGSPHDDPFA